MRSVSDVFWLHGRDLGTRTVRRDRSCAFDAVECVFCALHCVFRALGVPRALFGSVRTYVATVPAQPSKPVQGPRRLLVNPRVFGVAVDPDWRTVGRAAQADLRAARLQHEVAREVRAQISEQGLDLAPITEALGISQPQLLRKLRGEVAMSLIDIFTLAKETGVKFDWAVTKDSDQRQ